MEAIRAEPAFRRSVNDETAGAAALAAGTAPWWEERYLNGDCPWDTGIVPPEVVALVTSGLLTPGWALDLGCGSGVNSRYLAQHGFCVVGIDLAQSALVRAQFATVALPAFFCRGDVSDLGFLSVRATFALDIGCFHGVPLERRMAYISSLAGHLTPGAAYLLYAFELVHGGSDEARLGISSAAIALFAPHFTLRWVQHGRDSDCPSAWYLFCRAG